MAGATPFLSTPLTARPTAQVAAPQSAAPRPTESPRPVAPVVQAEVCATFPHDPGAFTQGLFFHDGRLFESTGQHGESAIREVDLQSGKVKREVRLPARYFGEGSTSWGDMIVSLTWRHGKGFRWDRETFRLLGEFTYPGEGWGLTQDGESLILSDGTAQLRFLDPETMAERRRITVTWQGRPIRQLNELEYVRGEVLANVWHTNLIARIDPKSGVIRGFIDLSAITAQLKLSDPESVLNGIAWDAKTQRLYVTGKRWPKLFEIALPE
ncbi:MAG: glutamine cyclotransferase [Alphaproteobacteria bacterium HGW-Alphaproteobacteria-16]|nr:MAG: glutamine cyclotransferase [Alphaproteobacteria bacterium HGW-Alphaproteobacteria-16]